MSTDSDLKIFTDIIEQNGRTVMEKAVDHVLNSNYDTGSVSSALKHHVKLLPNVLPLVPALMTLSCQAAGGTKDKPVGIGAALTLFVEAANMHDDIIDQTPCKHNRKTTFGKYGSNLTLLAGDFLIAQSCLFLFNECESLPIEEKNEVVALTFQALAKISKSAAKEIKTQRKFDVSPQDYLEVVRLRAAVPEVHCMIGGILGGGTRSMISCLGNYGRNYGIVGTVIDEFLDLYDYNKFSARLLNECVPLPVLCALENLEIKEKILPALNDFKVNKSDYDCIIKTVTASGEVKKLKKEILLLAAKSNLEINRKLRESIARSNLSTILTTVERFFCNIDEFTNQML